MVPCTSAFRDAIFDLVGRKRVNAGEMARSVMLLMPEDAARFPDPGPPKAEDRETVTLKSGLHAGKVWRRKPRLQVRMQAGIAIASIRRALALAVAMDRGDIALYLDKTGSAAGREKLAAAETENRRLLRQLRTLAFQPFVAGPKSRADALYILGFPQNADPSREMINRRYRERAAIYHPDTSGGDDTRMHQINDAVRILRNA